MGKWMMTWILLIVQLRLNAQDVRLSVIGSSTSAGYGFPGGINDPNCWVNRVVNYFNSNGYSVTLQNLAVGGYNAYQGMPNGSPSIEVGGNIYSPDVNKNITKSLSFTPDVVIVNYPSNLYDVADIHDVMSWLRQIKKTANNAGRICFVTTTQPRNFNEVGRNKLIELKDSILLQFGFYAVNFWNDMANPDGTINSFYGQGDGVHLNATAHDSLAKRVIRKDIFNIKVNRSAASGSWHNGDTWDKGIIPSLSDSVIIQSGHAVTLQVSVQVRALSIASGGSMVMPDPYIELKIGTAALNFYHKWQRSPANQELALQRTRPYPAFTFSSGNSSPMADKWR